MNSSLQSNSNKVWKVLPLFEAVEICDSLRKPVSSTEREKRIVNKSKAELFPYYGATGQVGFIDAYLTDGEYVLLGEDGAPFLDPFAAKAYVIDGKSWVNNHAHILRSKTSNRFLCYYLNSFNFKGYVSGSTRLKLTQAGMKKIPVPVPPFSEQERIVGILDAAFEKIDTIQRNAERNLANAKELFQQVLDEEMTPKPGWKKSLLKDVSQGITDGDHLPPPKEAKGIPFITISNITDQQKIDFSSTFFVSQNYYNSLAVIRKAQYGDILYTVTGSYGIPVLIDFNKQFCFQRHIAIIRPNIKLIDPLFLSFLLESSEIKKQADFTATGVAQKTVSLAALRKFVLFFPSLNEQKAIAKKLMCLKNKTFEIEDKYTNIKSNCAELKQQVLSSAFNGEL